jgi:hypothetical protein
MTVIESIIRGVQNLPLRQQVEVARYVHSLSVSSQQQRGEVLGRTHGVLGESDGEAFEKAMDDARRQEGHD